MTAQHLARWRLWLPLLVAVTVVVAVSAPVLEAPSASQRLTAPGARPALERAEGGIVRGPLDRRQLALIFSAHEFGEGAPAILDALSARGVRASFFLTGTFLRNEANAAVIRRMLRDGHYIGPHSDAHLLYCPWTGPKTTLVSQVEFTRDLERNFEALGLFGIQRRSARIFLPPYEWYNAEIARWSDGLGLTLVCHTPGTRSTADYTEEGTAQFVSSETILQSILRREQADPHGLSGFILLLHLGAGPGRSDKFHRRFDELMRLLAERGYRFVRIDQLVGEVEEPYPPSNLSSNR